MMTRALIVASLTLSLCACGSSATEALSNSNNEPTDKQPSDESSTAQSGSRLKARFVVAEGGAQRFLHFVDTETDEPCGLRPSTIDEQTVAHCLPAANGWLVYADDTCSRAVVQAPETDRVWITATDQVSVTAGVRRGPRVNGLDKVYFEYGRSGCIEWGVEPSSTPVFEIAEQRELDRWPQGTLELTTPSDRLEATVFRGDDGSRAVWDVIDSRSGTRCRPGETEAGPRCIPMIDTTEYVDEGLLNADCSQKAIVDYSVGAVIRLEGEIHRMTAQLRETPIAKLVDGDCQVQEPLQLGRMTLFFAEPYPASDWPVVEIDRFGGPDLIAELASASKQSVNPLIDQDVLALFMEPERNGRCGPAWVDETLRCVAPHSGSEHWFLQPYVDEECTQFAVSIQSEASPPPTVHRQVGRSGVEFGGLPEVEIFEVGERLRSQGYLRHADGTCAPSSFFSDVYTLGARLPATDFAPLRLID